jgi:signal transduction histidine kinase
MEYFDFLKRVYFFKNLTDEEIKLVLSLCKEGSCQAGEILCEEGKSADRFYIVVAGRVEVYKNFNDDKPDLLAVHGAGNFFGEMALVDDLPRSATVVAKEDSQYLFLSRDDFQSLVRKEASIALSVMTSMSFLVRSSNDLYVEDLRKRNKQLEMAYAELERTQAKQLRNERLSTLGKFSSMILHDIRNPIAIIKGQLQLILMHLHDADRLRRFVENIDSQTSKLERLAGEFLDYSRGEVRLNFSVTTPSLLLEKIADSALPQLQRDGIAFESNIEADTPALLDFDRIQRVLYNLVDNARKACLEVAEKRITVTINSTEERFILSVRDSGVGMTPEVQQHIFEPFFSASGAGGTGLGLLIVKNVVEAHGGTLDIQTALGQGTVFTLDLPRRM